MEIVQTILDMEKSDIIALLALIFSIIGGIFTFINSLKQNKINNQQETINKYILEREEQNHALEKKAQLHLSIINFGKDKKLRISNIGKNDARNIFIEFQENQAHVFSFSDDLFPIELKPMGKIDIVMSQYIGCPTKYNITAQWDDDFKEENKETFIIAR
ncbi:hypothetical protein C6378_03750 [Acinetobacter pittii]|uniref:hypothetical protein n=1 Tax=Acinetobacter pittii TaxID=48296 RepID=UPI001373DC19|nr:hypothetical protein [Acinetobacter pittii]MBQ5174505.1 hypothetical protein [Acinetobacter pittii]QHQ33093.1 hypothetical protein EPY81_17690 [Acinetobacter pittii]USQ62777.1 hypothetical protein C7A15_19005 [Acinetobacter pittii]UTD33392.1 hypothetical protein DDE02_05950 [Acinetobacter pittii]